MHATSTEGGHPIHLLTHPWTFTHVNLCPYSDIRPQVCSRFKDTDFENVFVSGYIATPEPSPANRFVHLCGFAHKQGLLPTLPTSLPASALESHLPT